MLDPLLPWCLVCDREVQSCTSEKDILDGTITLTVRCHGSRETWIFDDAVLLEERTPIDLHAFARQGRALLKVRSDS